MEPRCPSSACGGTWRCSVSSNFRASRHNPHPHGIVNSPSLLVHISFSREGLWFPLPCVAGKFGQKLALFNM